MSQSQPVARSLWSHQLLSDVRPTALAAAKPRFSAAAAEINEKSAREKVPNYVESVHFVGFAIFFCTSKRSLAFPDNNKVSGSQADEKRASCVI